MTKFADELLDDLMREHGSTLAQTRPPAAPRRHVPGRRTMLVTGAGCLAVGAVAGTLVANSGGTSSHPNSGHAARAGTSAYSVTKNPDGTVTLAVYKPSGIAAANARLRQLDDGQVVIVPVGAGCPAMSSLPAPAVPGGHISVQEGGDIKDGSITVNAQGIPAGDILVVAVQTTANGSSVSTLSGSRLTTPPAPSCVSMPAAPPPPPSGSGSVSGSSG